MKRRIVKLLVAMVASTTIAGCHTVKTAQSQETVKENQLILDSVEIYHTKTQKDFDKLTEILERRQGKIIIEIVDGVVLDNDGNGKEVLIDGTETDSGLYIKYDSERFKKGDRVQSIFIYNPDNNCLDDIVYRADTLIE